MYCLKFLLLILLIPLVKSSCPIGSIAWQTKCYYFQSNAAGFTNAEVYCASFGGHLASVHDGFTNSLLTENAKTNFQQSSTSDFWVGLSNLENGGILSWADGTTVDYTDWDVNQPIYTENNCASVNSNNGRWKIDECFVQNPFVCATDNLIPTTPPPPQNCSGSLQYYAPTDSCYGVFFSRYIDRQDWSSAESYCQSINGHLASVHSHDEYQFIITLWNFAHAYNEPWLGLYSNNNGYSWQWSDGTPVDYFPWEAGYPHTADTYYCAYASKNGLENYYCSYHYSAVCKIKLYR